MEPSGVDNVKTVVLRNKGHGENSSTRGNAFFATECLRALIEEGALTRHLGTWTAAPEPADRPLPRSIQEVVLARLARRPKAA